MGPRKFLFGVAPLGLVAAAFACTPTTPLPPALDLELRDLGFVSAEAAGLSAKAEAALETNRLGEAETLLARARRAAPSSGFPARRHCEVLTALGHRDEALAACKSAMALIGSVVELRASVGALMTGAKPPTADVVADAYTMASGAQKLRTDLPYGYAALFDIAYRLGDQEMMRTNLNELRRVAPTHGETLRAEGKLKAPARWWRGLGWLALGLLSLVTLRRRGRAIPSSILPTGRAVGITCVLLAAVGLAPATGFAATSPPVPATGSTDVPASADKFSAFQINADDPAGHLPTEAEANANPLQFGYMLMDLSSAAENAVKKGDHKAAIKYFQALAKAVPGKSIAHGRLCREYEALGDRTAALAACREALGRTGVQVEDYDRYVRLTLAHPGAVTAAEKEDVLAIVKHLRATNATRSSAADLECQLAARVGDGGLLEKCVSELVVLAPNASRTITYQWTLAVRKGNSVEAAKLVERARQIGMQSAGIDQMVEATKAARGSARIPVLGALLAVGALLFAGVFFYGRNDAASAPKTTATATRTWSRNKA